MLALIVVLILAIPVVVMFAPLILAPKDSNGYVVDHNYDPKNPPQFAPIPTAEEIRKYTGDRPRTPTEIASELPDPEEAEVA